MLKTVPNIISCSRAGLSPLLLFAVYKPVLFIILYGLCGLSDIADGYLARRYDAKTKLGSRLDSLGDFIFFAVLIYIYSQNVKTEHYNLIMISIVGVALIRVVNLVITKIKFMQWSIMHTMGNKAAGFALFLVMPFFILAGRAPFWSILVVGILAAMSALEEAIILLLSATYDADRRSYFVS